MRDGEQTEPQPAGTRDVLVWDLPTRLFHWTLACLLVGSVATVKLGAMELHALCGFSILTLVIWRVLWGVLGSENVRFAHFLAGPRQVLGHIGHILRRRPDEETSHNALGGWAVIVLLGLVGAQASTGLFANDDILFHGPLAPLVGKAMSDRITGWHFLIKNALLAMIGLHVAAVLFYRFALRHRLIDAMVTGRKRLPASARAPAHAGTLRALLLLGLAAAAVRGIVTLA